MSFNIFIVVVPKERSVGRANPSLQPSQIILYQELFVYIVLLFILSRAKGAGSHWMQRVHVNIKIIS